MQTEADRGTVVSMSVTNYFLPKAADECDLSAWSPILPSSSRIVRTNLFGDAFVVAENGTVHLLDRGGCSIEPVASSEEEFWREVRDDSNGWQLRHLADSCRNAGKLLADGQCYAYTTPPVLGGKYTVDNVWVARWSEWFSLMADVFQQIEGLPDGATVSFKLVD